MTGMAETRRKKTCRKGHTIGETVAIDLDPFSTLKAVFFVAHDWQHEDNPKALRLSSTYIIEIGTVSN